MIPQSSQPPFESHQETLFTQLRQQHWFCRLQTQLEQRQQLQQLFDQECPFELAGQCRVLGLKDNCLQVELANAGSATQLQFRTRELLIALRKHAAFTGLKKIHGQIARVSLPVSNVQAEPIQELPAETVLMFKQLADGLEEGELKAALLNLIK